MITGFVLPADAIARGLGWRETDYTTPYITSYGTGKYMAQELSPDDYWESQYWNQLQMAFGLEMETLLRVVQFIPSDIAQRILNNDWPNEVEGILAQWLPQTVSGPFLVWWEEFLGIPSDISQTDVVRRITIHNQLLNSGQSPTVQYMLNIVLQYVNNAVIIDQNALSTGTHDNSFLIRIIDPVGVPPTDSLMRAAIETFKPASLAYTIQYSETDFIALAERDFVALGETDFSNLNY